MILTLVTLAIVILLALYMSKQGLLTAILVFASGLFASMLAMGFFESAADFLSKWPDVARGTAFLGVFLVSFGALIFAADYFIRENIKLPPLVDKIAGGFVGFFAGLIIVGTTITGIEMMPITESIAGTAEVQNDAPPGPANRVFAANFVTNLYYLASGKALLGTPIALTHPDLPAELTGMRHAVWFGSRNSIDPSLVDVPKSGWYMGPPETLKFHGLDAAVAATGKPLALVVRTSIAQGGEPPKSSFDQSDQGQVLMLSTTQVRLVTANERGDTRQYYPVGFIEGGTSFHEMPLGTGYTIDDYAGGNAKYDWVFAVDDGQIPQFIEIKNGGRVSLADKRADKPLTRLASSEYPPHKWEKGAAMMTYTVMIGGKPVENALVLRLNANAKKSGVSDLISDIKDSGESSQGWLRTFLINSENAAKEDPIAWSQLANLALDSHKSAGLNAAWEYYTGKLLKQIEDSDSLRQELRTDEKGEAFGKVLSGNYVLLVIGKKDDVLHGWVRDFAWIPDSSGQKPDESKLHQVFEDGKAESAPYLTIDLNKP